MTNCWSVTPVSWPYTLTQCGQTRHVISFLLALHTFPWPAGKSPLVPGLTFQLLCIYLTSGQILYHPVIFFFLNGASRQTIFVGKSAESGCALWPRMKWFASLPFRKVTDRHIWLKSTGPPLLSPAARTQQRCVLSAGDAPHCQCWVFAVGSCSQPRLARCHCLLTATCLSSASSLFSSETRNQVKLAQCQISLPNWNSKLKEALGLPRFTSLLSA